MIIPYCYVLFTFSGVHFVFDTLMYANTIFQVMQTTFSYLFDSDFNGVIN